VIRSRSGSSARLDIAVLERSTQPKSSADSARPKPFRHDGRAWDSDGRGIGFNGVCPREPSSSRDCWQASSSLVASAAVSPRATVVQRRSRIEFAATNLVNAAVQGFGGLARRYGRCVDC
jgi:hypothetical protein